MFPLPSCLFYTLFRVSLSCLPRWVGCGVPCGRQPPSTSVGTLVFKRAIYIPSRVPFSVPLFSPHRFSNPRKRVSNQAPQVGLEPLHQSDEKSLFILICSQPVESVELVQTCMKRVIPASGHARLMKKFQRSDRLMFFPTKDFSSYSEKINSARLIFPSCS